MNKFQPFEHEVMASRHEKNVDYNLSESGVHPITLRELLADNPEEINRLFDTEIDYAHANGIPELRANIAALYPNCQSENVMVTVGAIEANYDAIQALLQPGDEMAIMLPNYLQIWGVAKNLRLKINTFHLDESNGWQVNQAELKQAVTPKTKVIAVCNPNNPTGHILTEEEMKTIINAAQEVGAWILADEVYAGAERVTDRETPSFYGRYDKVIAVGSLSKAYGLPGLRVGWAVAPPNIIENIWRRHEYITLSTSIISNKLAAFALSPKVRPRLIQRAREYIRQGFPLLQQWIEQQKDVFHLVPPQAAAIAFVGYHLNINSTDLATKLIQEKSVLIVPGDHFGVDKFIRISYGLPPDYLTEGLTRIQQLVTTLKSL
ncbi:MAG TPA: aminotransferase class I/II-fold pyridoxal phosphate-dependent enzyme [Candidatus Aminicenantes bacterium]|nr:aminotransferase class I/II-fold pyridoxal phosphate-dependent enzyme [Candidatus Aminicenantes bacterium]